MRVYLGNRDAADVVDGEVVHVKGKQRTEITGPQGATAGELFVDITKPTQGVWDNHTVSGRDVAAVTKPPVWVSSDSDLLAQMLGDHFGCEVRAFLPDGERGEFAFDDGRSKARKRSSAARSNRSGVATSTVMLMLLGFLLFAATRLQLKTNAGNDFQASVMGNAAASGAGTGASRAADYMALSTSATAPSASDTTLGSEITTAGGGLIRKQATYAHTTGAASYTLTATFTANGSDSLPVTVKKIGIFNASGAGTLVFETATTDATWDTSGDAVTYTETVAT